MEKIYNERLASALTSAAENAFKKLFSEHSENYYYCTLIMAEEGTPFIAACSEESLDAVIKNAGITDPEEILDYKWSYADSPYCAYGYDEFFGEIEKLHEELPNLNADDNDYEQQTEIWLSSMEEAMKRLDKSGLFGNGEKRLNMVINAEIMPPDYSNTLRAKRLNPEKSLKKWLEEAAENEYDR